MATLLTKVKAKMHFHSHRLSQRMLEGEYGSIFHGHSLDFDDLREYVPGDEIRDIDWKATARHSTALVKRYVAHRRHTLGLVVNTGAELEAQSAAGENKRELAILVAGMAGYLAVRNGDDVRMFFGTRQRTGVTDSGNSEAHLEHMLRTILYARNGEFGNVNHQLGYIASSVPRRMMLVVISDEGTLPDKQVLRRLATQHDVMWVRVTDADLGQAGLAGDLTGVADGDALSIPQSMLNDRSLQAEYAEAERRRQHEFNLVLQSTGIASVQVSSSNDALWQLFRLMRRHASARQS